MFGCNGKFHFPEIHFLLTNIYSFDQELILHSYFRFKSFPEKEREREREERAQIGERERKKREPARSSDEREETKRRSSDERVHRMIAPLVDRDCERARRSKSGAIVRRARSSIAPRVGRSHRSRLQSRQGPRDLIFSSAAPIFSSDLACTYLMNFFAGFCFSCE